MLALDPKYRLCRSKTNVFFYHFDKEIMDLVDQKCLHPNTAIFLTFFNGENSLEEIRSAAKFIFDIPENEFDKKFNDFLKEWDNYFIETDKRIRFDNPNDYIISADKLDMSKIQLEKPLYIGYNVTQKCGGRKCIYCYAETNEIRNFKEMSFTRVQSIIEECVDLRIEFLNIGGGDPFVYPHLFYIIEKSRSAGINVHLSTKQFIKAKTARKLKELGINRIQFSLDCLDNNLSEKMTNIKMYSSKAIETIKLLINNGITVNINAVVTSININDIPNLIERLISIGIKRISLSQYNRSGYHHTDSLFVSKVQMQELNDYVLNLKSKHSDVDISLSSSYVFNEQSDENSLKRFLNRPSCSAGKTSMMIMPDGSVIPCEQIPCESSYILGDISQQSILEVWHSTEFQDFFHPQRECFKGSVCYDCDDFDLCIYRKGWCFRDAWKAYGTIYQTNPNCPKAKKNQGKRLF